MDQDNPGIALGDTFWFALLAYIIVLLPWTASFAGDFISPTWATLGRTKVSAKCHLVLFILAPLLIAYISLQPLSREPDFKEMFTVITALVIGIYHFLRSLVGLRQLQRFHDWAKTIAILMERGRYWKSLQPFNESVQNRNQSEIWDMILHILNIRQQFRELDMMGVNNSIVDNELVGGEAQNVSFALEQLHTKIRFFGKKMDPLEAKFTTFVRWSVGFLAQFGDKWLKDIAGTRIVESEFRRTNKRREFAVQVLAAATLRMGRIPLPQKEYKSPTWESRLLFQKSNLPLGAWQRITKRTNDIVFSREEFATVSFRTSFHMPGGKPVLLSKENSGEVVERNGYGGHDRSFFDPLIAEARSALHPTLYDYLRKHEAFSSLQLEWFAAFLCTQCEIEDSQDGTDNYSRAKPEKDSIYAELDKVPDKVKERENETDAAVRLLKRQLGFGDSVASRTFYYPFLKDAYEQHFWENRAILEVSARMDNWLAICSGRQVSFLEQKQPECAKNECSQAQGDQDHEVFEQHKKLEIKALKHQLTDMGTNHWHMEHGLSFLGCIVESVRSALADQTFLRGSELGLGEKEWRPTVPNKKVGPMVLSRELWDCINSNQVLDTAAQERLLSECQQGTYASLCKKYPWLCGEEKSTATQSGVIHKEIEAMLLIIMGFPSITILRESPGKFIITPVLAPQPLQVHVQVKGIMGPMGKVKPIAVLGMTIWSEQRSKRQAPTPFCWQDWRDAFEGRLAGRYEWQKDHLIPAAPVMRDEERRGTMAKFTKPIKAHEKGWNRPALVWDGWKPFRPGMAIFELKHLLFSTEAEDSTESLLQRHRSATDKYNSKDEITPDLLSAAMLSLDALLGHDEGLDKLDDDLEERKLHGSELLFGRKQNWFGGYEEQDEDDQKKEEDRKKKKVKELIRQARNFVPDAMHKLAHFVDNVNFPEPELVISLMEGALNFKRETGIAESIIDKMLADYASLTVQKRQEAVKKARHAIELLWLDVEAKHKRKMETDEGATVSWNMEGEEAVEFEKIIKLHMRVVMAQPTGTMMMELADRIAKYGYNQDHEERAIKLYESAIIANADPLPIIKLATMHASNECTKGSYAYDLLCRARQVAKTGPHSDIVDIDVIRVKSEFDVMKELYRLAEVGNPGARCLFKLQYKLLQGSKEEDERQLYNEIREFLKKRADNFGSDYGKRILREISDGFVVRIDP